MTIRACNFKSRPCKSKKCWIFWWSGVLVVYVLLAPQCNSLLGIRWLGIWNMGKDQRETSKRKNNILQAEAIGRIFISQFVEIWKICFLLFFEELSSYYSKIFSTSAFLEFKEWVKLINDKHFLKYAKIWKQVHLINKFWSIKLVLTCLFLSFTTLFWIL